MKKHYIFGIIAVVIAILVWIFGSGMFQINKELHKEQYQKESNCTANYRASTNTMKLSRNEQNKLVPDVNGEPVTTTESQLDIHCDCDITYDEEISSRNETVHYDFDTTQKYDYELDEEQQECKPICDAFCEEKLQELRSKK